MKRFDEKFGQEFLAQVPRQPGVYFYFGPSGELLYVGRARNLYRRISQYRNAKRLKAHAKMRALVGEASRLTFQVCTSHWEAAVEELRLIQQKQPRWNVEGRFSYLYPSLGIAPRDGALAICLTTHPNEFEGYRWVGAFRSRKVVGNAFFALVELLGLSGHPTRQRKRSVVPHSYERAFKKLPDSWMEEIQLFWRGESNQFLQLLFEELLNRPGARAKGDAITAHFRALKRFYFFEARQLYKALSVVGGYSLPVAQADRDLLFMKYRLIEGKRF